MPPRVEYSVVVPVPMDDAFTAFLNHERLLHRGIYKEASWIEGEPWQVGSRARYVIIKPVSAIISAVVSSINPPRSIHVLNHGIGVTAEQNVYFAPAPNGGTQVRMTMDFVGKSPGLTQDEILSALQVITKDLLDNLVAFCRRRVG
jgi:hypothetical protein